MNAKIQKWLDYIQEFNNQEIRLALRFKTQAGEMVTTKWKDTNLQNWNEKYPGKTPNYRQILDNEIVIESDLPTKEDNKAIADKIINILRYKNINYWCIFTGSKSYHIHIMLPISEVVNDSNRVEIKKRVVKNLIPAELYKHIDEANFYNTRLIQIEFAQNPKTGQMPQPYSEWLTGSRPEIPVLNDSRTGQIAPMAAWKRNLAPEYCAELEYMLDHYVKDSSRMTRHHMILPSFAAYVRFKPNRKELIERFCKTQKKDPSEIEGWDALNTYFGHKQIREYFEANGLGHISALCLLGGGQNE